MAEGKCASSIAVAESALGAEPPRLVSRPGEGGPEFAEAQGRQQVESVEFLDEDATFEEFQRLFEDQPDFVSAIKPEELPQSFRIKPSRTEADVVSAVGAEFEDMPGVLRVEYAEEYARQVQRSLTTS